MLRNILVVAGLVLATGATGAERMPSGPPVGDSPSHDGSTPLATESTTGRIQVGDSAPAFSFMGTDGGWRAFRQLFSGGAVLLVFGAEEDQLRDLDALRPVFADLGVSPVAVLDMSSGSASRFVRRIHLGCSVVSDPRRAIGDLYGSLDLATRRHAPSYFVVDGRGMIRGYRHGPLPSARQLLMTSARHLGRPLPESAWMMSHQW